MKNKILSALLAVLMVMTVVPFATVSVSAALAVQSLSGADLIATDGRFESLHNPDKSVGNWTVMGYTISQVEFDGREYVAKIEANGEVFQGIAVKDPTNIKPWGEMNANFYEYGVKEDSNGQSIKAVNANYIAVDYYYDTTGRVDENEEGRESLEGLGMIWVQNSLSDGTSTWGQKPSSNTMIADEWDTIYIPVNYSEKAVDGSVALAQYGFHPLGRFNGPAKMYTGDALYISEVRFSSYDPENFEASTRVVDFYLSEEACETGDPYDSYDVKDLETIELISVAEDDIPADKVFVGWKDLATGTVYDAGASYTLVNADDVTFVPVWQDANVDTSIVYYAEDGEVNGSTASVYTDFASAVEAVDDGGTIVVDGRFDYPTGELNIYKNVTIKGYDENAYFNTAAFNTRIWTNGSTITFDDIKIVRADGAEPEGGLGIVNGTLVIGDGVTYQNGLTTNWGSTPDGTPVDIRFGLPAYSTGAQEYHFSSESLSAVVLSPMINYFGSGSDTLAGDFYAEINAGTFNTVYGIANDNSNGVRTHDGDTKYVINGGTIGTIVTAASRFGKTTGDIVFEINGGDIGTIKLGNANAHSNNSATVNTYVIIDVANLVAGGYNVPAVTDGVASINSGDNVVIYNNVEDLPEGAELTAPANATTFAQVSGGYLVLNADGTFEAVANDDAKSTVFVNGAVAIANDDGNYELPAGNVNVVFDEEPEGVLVAVTFDGGDPVYYMSGAKIVLPTVDGLFGAWTDGEGYYNDGDSYTVPYEAESVEFVSVEPTMADSKYVIYVDQAAGKDTNGGLIEALPVKTLAQAKALYDVIADDVVINIIGTYSDNLLWLPAISDAVYTGGTLEYGDGMVVNTATKFENITIKANTQWKFIEIGANNVIFGEGVKKAEDSQAIDIHFGPSGLYSQGKVVENIGDWNITFESGVFGGVSVGPNYIYSESAISDFTGNIYVTIDGDAIVGSVKLGDGYIKEGEATGYNKQYTINGELVVEVADNAKLGSFTTMSKYCTALSEATVNNYSVNEVKYTVYDGYPDAAEYTMVYNIGYFEPAIDDADPTYISGEVAFYAIDGNGAVYNAEGGDGYYELWVPGSGSYTFYEGASVADLLTVDGAQIRTTGVQGLRFIANYDFDIDKIYEVEEFGFVVLPTTILDGAELKADATYEYEGETYKPGVVPATKLFAEPTELSQQYTVCITGIEDYDRDYTVRTYVVVDGEYIYGAKANTNVRYMAQKAYDEHVNGTTTLGEDVLATMMGILGITE